MDKAIRIKDTCVCEDLGCTVGRKMLFQRSMYIFGKFFDQGILTVLKDGDLILGFLPFVQMVIPVRDETGTGNDSPDTFAGLLAPFPTWEAEGLVHVYIVMTIDKFDLGTRPRPVLLDLLGDSGFCHSIVLLYISVISLRA